MKSEAKAQSGPRKGKMDGSEGGIWVGTDCRGGYGHQARLRRREVEESGKATAWI